MKVLGYTRVSTAEQAESGAGLQAQRDSIEHACKTRGIDLVTIVEDAGFSAKDLRRPGISHVLRELQDGTADALMVAKLDRLSRSLLDFAAVMERARSEKWAVIALDLGVDTTTPSGEMMASVLAVFAQFERRLIGQRTRDALAMKKASGVQLGRRRSVPDQVVRSIIDMRSHGMTLQQISDELNRNRIPTAHGGALWRPGTISSILRSNCPSIPPHSGPE
ncbi:MAG: hypothetical protein QOD39_3261 [Mycobacterium sp.]|nr:hypothetical protein [Mycobacterium sp.]